MRVGGGGGERWGRKWGVGAASSLVSCPVMGGDWVRPGDEVVSCPDSTLSQGKGSGDH